MKSSPYNAFPTIKQLADSNKCIDDAAARKIAQYLFEVEDALAKSARVYKLKFGCDALNTGQTKIKANRYARKDGLYVYFVRVGYDSGSNIIVYSEKIDRERCRVSEWISVKDGKPKQKRRLCFTYSKPTGYRILLWREGYFCEKEISENNIAKISSWRVVETEPELWMYVPKLPE